MQKTINGSLFKKMIIAGGALLEQNKKIIDSLNVFPVPDGDTGTNMSMTMKSATKEVANCMNTNLSSISEAFAKGALRGARGNSGVILSQIIKGITNVISTCEEVNTKTFAKAIQEGTNIAYKAVTKPKEGTILTVVRVMGETAVECAKKCTDLEQFLQIVIEQGEEILKQTPEMLPVLKKAGVVDAGGRGLIILFTGFYKALIGDESMDVDEDESSMVEQTVDEVIADINNLAEIEFGYCTEFMVINMHKKTTEANIDKLREKLMQIGDSVICIGDLSLVKVHVHTNQPNIALGYALELGELYNLKIENMLEQNRQLKENAKNEELKPLGMVAVAAGEGIANLFKDLTVDKIIRGGQTMNPSAADIAAAVDKVNAQDVFVFPNNKNIILAAEQAKDLSKRTLHVVPTKSIPEGISASLAFNPESSVSENLDAMIATLENVKSGAVTYAVRATHVDGFELSIGEIIGLDDKAILAKGKEISSTTEELIDKMINENVVNITLIYGQDVKEKEANDLCEKIVKKYPNCEVTVIDGGQPVYYYLISLE